MTGPPGTSITGSGTGSIAAHSISGIVATGDHVLVDARTTCLVAGSVSVPDPAWVTAPRGCHNLPRPPAPAFVGREGALRLLATQLTSDATARAGAQVVQGLGGVGKSELALQHAHTRTKRRIRWWITAEDRQQIEAGLASLAARLCPSIALAGTTSISAEWALGWLQSHDRWLLILDNVNAPEDVEPLLGQLQAGSILVTTRRDIRWNQATEPICLTVLDPVSSARLLTTRTGQAGIADRQTAALIAAELGCLPLALEQAAAYISQTRVSLDRYLHQLRQRPARMHAAGGGTQRSIARTWDITIGFIKASNPAALQFLHVLACYAPDSVPRVILGDPGSDADRSATDETLGLLASYSMITLTSDSVSMHRLVQATLIQDLRSPDSTYPAPGPGSPIAIALDWLANAIPDNTDTDMASWTQLRALLPHADRLAGLLRPSQHAARMAHVQAELARFQDSQGQYEQAFTRYQSALAFSEAAHGPHRYYTGYVLGGLAFAHWRLGRYAEALALQQQALGITLATLGPDHPNTALHLGHIAGIYRTLGQPDQALPLQQRAAHICEAALGTGHPLTAVQLDNLAVTYRVLARPDQALLVQQRAIDITEAALGPSHPDTAIALHNLATIHRDLGQQDEALPLQQRAVEITQASHGPDHPDTALQLANLAAIYRALGQPGKVLEISQQALAITQAALGSRHPDTALQLSNLAATHHDLGQLDHALPLAQQALETGPSRDHGR